MNGHFVRVVTLAVLAAMPALAQGVTRAPEKLTPHYSVQVPPEEQDVVDQPDAASTAAAAEADQDEAASQQSNSQAAQQPPVAAPTPRVDSGSQTQPAASYGSDPWAGLGDDSANEHVVVSATRSLADSYRLGPGDKLRLIVFGEDDLSGNFEIDGQGYVRLPLIGQVEAYDLTAYELERRISTAFVKGGYLLSPKVSVEITGYRPFYIIGEVSKPGEYSYVNAMSALNAIAMAGGFTDRAVTSEIYIRHRGDNHEYEVALNETTRIQPGDVVRVGRTTYWAVMTFLAPLMSPFTAAAYLLR